MASFREAFLGKRFVCCALTIVYSIYNTVGRSIADMYDPRRHIYRGAKRRGKYAAEVVYRMDLNFRGTKLSRFSRFDSHP